MQAEEYRLLFEADYTLCRKPSQPSKIMENLSYIVSEDPYIKTKSKEKAETLLLFMTNCIYIAQSARTEISIDVSENDEKVTAFWAAPTIRFNAKTLLSLAPLCLSAMNMTIISGDKDNENALICFEFNLSDQKITLSERIK